MPRFITQLVCPSTNATATLTSSTAGQLLVNGSPVVAALPAYILSSTPASQTVETSPDSTTELWTSDPSQHAVVGALYVATISVNGTSLDLLNIGIECILTYGIGQYVGGSTAWITPDGRASMTVSLAFVSTGGEDALSFQIYNPYDDNLNGTYTLASMSVVEQSTNPVFGTIF